MGTDVAQRLTLWLVHGLIAFCGMFAFWFLWYTFLAAVPPITWHGNAVYPSHVRAGGTIEITRSYTVHREVILTVNRSLVTGDCAKHCTSYGMPSTVYHLEPGTITRTVPHTVPDYIPPGRYRLEFSMVWQNSIGKDFSLRHPMLEIEDIP